MGLFRENCQESPDRLRNMDLVLRTLPYSILQPWCKSREMRAKELNQRVEPQV